MLSEITTHSPGGEKSPYEQERFQEFLGKAQEITNQNPNFQVTVGGGATKIALLTESSLFTSNASRINILGLACNRKVVRTQEGFSGAYPTYLLRQPEFIALAAFYYQYSATCDQNQELQHLAASGTILSPVKINSLISLARVADTTREALKQAGLTEIAQLIQDPLPSISSEKNRKTKTLTNSSVPATITHDTMQNEQLGPQSNPTEGATDPKVLKPYIDLLTSTPIGSGGMITPGSGETIDTVRGRFLEALRATGKFITEVPDPMGQGLIFIVNQDPVTPKSTQMTVRQDAKPIQGPSPESTPRTDEAVTPATPIAEPSSPSPLYGKPIEAEYAQPEQLSAIDERTMKVLLDPSPQPEDIETLIKEYRKIAADASATLQPQIRESVEALVSSLQRRNRPTRSAHELLGSLYTREGRIEDANAQFGQALDLGYTLDFSARPAETRRRPASRPASRRPGEFSPRPAARPVATTVFTREPAPTPQEADAQSNRMEDYTPRTPEETRLLHLITRMGSNPKAPWLGVEEIWQAVYGYPITDKRVTEDYQGRGDGKSPVFEAGVSLAGKFDFALQKLKHELQDPELQAQLRPEAYEAWRNFQRLKHNIQATTDRNALKKIRGKIAGSARYEQTAFDKRNS